MARKRRRLFTVQTPLGYRVFLERDRWRQIVGFKHPALAGQEKKLRACLASPAVIRESIKEPNVHLYYADAAEGHLCVVVAPAAAEEWFVVTAYLTTNMKKGKQRWTR